MRPVSTPQFVELGYPAMYEEHRKLQVLVDRLSSALRHGRASTEVAQILDSLADSTESHFRWEEQLMTAHAFPRYEPHRLEHVKLHEQIRATRANLESGGVPEWNVLDLFLRSWLTHHIVKFDGDLAEFLRSQPLPAGDRGSPCIG